MPADRTVLDALAARLASATADNHATEHAPVVLLWTDGDGKWEPALAALRARVTCPPQINPSVAEVHATLPAPSRTCSPA
ncbi:MAG: hypothetical protein H6747_01335 [Deltaproteobacteria bacterium]|nr:hypothetical protein [Polyangiaceae bacterium]MCB9737876.1 hypothetical protein [Deltaproteobacteria bacterium]